MEQRWLALVSASQWTLMSFNLCKKKSVHKPALPEVQVFGAFFFFLAGFFEVVWCLSSLTAESRNYFQFPDRQETSKETLEHNLPKMDISGQELVQDPQAPMERLWQLKKYSQVSKRDLQTMCCVEGCSMTELSTLC